MPNDPKPPVEVSFTPEFKRNLRQLAKKYHHIKSDLQETLHALARGEKPGDQIPGVAYEVFKVRAKNSDARKGKSGGYRIIYYVKDQQHVILVTLYSKTEQTDVEPKELRRIIEDHDQTAREESSAKPQEEDGSSST
jgi:mRNA-degrading endonuclease RelE of RelBE toxin-antitoxin system